MIQEKGVDRLQLKILSNLYPSSILLVHILNRLSFTSIFKWGPLMNLFGTPWVRSPGGNYNYADKAERLAYQLSR